MPGLVIVPEFDGNLTRTISETASLGRTPSATRSSLSNVSTMRLSGAIDSGGELQDAESAPGDDSEELTEDEEFDLSELRSRMLTSQTAAQLGKHRKSIRSSFDIFSARKRSVDLPVFPKESSDRQKLERALDNIFLFEHLQPKQREQLVDAFEPKAVAKGEVVIREGDSENVQHLYVITQGRCVVTKTNPAQEHVVVHTARELECFGELALLYNQPRAATVTADAEQDTFLFALHRDSFQFIVQSAGMQNRERYEEFMQRVGALAGLSRNQRSQIADVLQTRNYSAGEHIIREGDPKANMFYILFSGQAVASKAGMGVLKEYSEGDCFGELALLMDQPRAATVTATGECTCVCIDRASFTRLLGPYQDLLNSLHTSPPATDCDPGSPADEGGRRRWFLHDDGRPPRRSPLYSSLHSTASAGRQIRISRSLSPDQASRRPQARDVRDRASPEALHHKHNVRHHLSQCPTSTDDVGHCPTSTDVRHRQREHNVRHRQMMSGSDGAGLSPARPDGDALPMQAVRELESEVVQKLRGEMQQALAQEQARNDALVQRLKCEHQVHTHTQTHSFMFSCMISRYVHTCTCSALPAFSTRPSSFLGVGGSITLPLSG